MFCNKFNNGSLWFIFFACAFILVINHVSARDTSSELCDLSCKPGDHSSKSIGGNPIKCCPSRIKRNPAKSGEIETTVKSKNYISNGSKNIGDLDLKSAADHHAIVAVKREPEHETDYSNAGVKPGDGVQPGNANQLRRLPMLPMTHANPDSPAISKRLSQQDFLNDQSIFEISPSHANDMMLSRFGHGKRGGAREKAQDAGINTAGGNQNIAIGNILEQLQTEEEGNRALAILLLPRASGAPGTDELKSTIATDKTAEDNDRVTHILQNYIKSLEDESSDTQALRDYLDVLEQGSAANLPVIQIMPKRQAGVRGFKNNAFSMPGLGFGKRERMDLDRLLNFGKRGYMDDLAGRTDHVFNNFSVKGKRMSDILRQLSSLGKRYQKYYSGLRGVYDSSPMSNLGRYASFGKRESLHADMLTPFIIEDF